MLRRVPLKRTAPLRSTAELVRTPWRRGRQRHQQSAHVRQAVLRRDGACAAPGAFGLRCGGRTEVHHVETKGMGGKRSPDTVDDLMALCRVHHAYVTTHPAAAIAAGLARRRNR